MSDSPIRVLLVDDSAVVRQMVASVLEAYDDITIAGQLPSGEAALRWLPRLKPDLVVLDVQMPGLTGLETLAEIRRSHEDLPVLMFSSVTVRGAMETLEALALGASDYVTKPRGTRSVAEAMERIRADLIPRIRLLGAPPRRTSATGPRPRPSADRGGPGPGGRVDFVAMALSTGGPRALADMVPALPDDFPVPLVIVQHMPPVFTQQLAERLDCHSGLTVREAVSGERLTPGTVWIAPGDHHVVVERIGGTAYLRTHQGPAENFSRPSADVLLRSAAAVYGEHALAVIMTGMGGDGVKGCGAVRDAGGQVIAQDRASSLVWGMPGLVVDAGLADAVVPLGEVVAEILARVERFRVVRAPPSSAPGGPSSTPDGPSSRPDQPSSPQRGQ